jgi:pimeloyl-ACP methyl ester carboxylesterase
MLTQNLARRRLHAFVLAPALALVALISLGAGGHAGAGSHHRGGLKPTIVLVHGDWADGSSWSSVIQRLQAQGFTVVAPPNPLRGPTEDSASIAAFLQSISGPIVLVAHSYGGFVITNAATGNPNVKALVYIDAFIPAQGETLGGLTGGSGSCIDTNNAFNAVPSGGGVDLYLRVEPNQPYTGFADCFANGVNPPQTAVLAATQRPAALNQLFEPSGTPAWKTIPSWALIGTEDHVIPPALQEFMSTRAGAEISTVKAGHLSLITRPETVAKVILAAVDATT